MTENKRFKYYEHKGADYILENPNEDLDFIEMLGDCLDSEEIVNRLNKLYDENEQLQFELKECNDNRRFSRRELKKENEQLKQFIMDLKTKNTGRIDLANGNSYNVKYVLKGVWKNEC